MKSMLNVLLLNFNFGGGSTTIAWSLLFAGGGYLPAELVGVKVTVIEEANTADHPFQVQTADGSTYLRS